MSAENPFKDIALEPAAPPKIKRRYSVTADVAAYLRCPRQYGAFHVTGFAPSRQRQMFFGQVLHQVLDRLHFHYQGRLSPEHKGQVPDGGATLSAAEIQDYFRALQSSSPPSPPSQLLAYYREVEQGLFSQGLHRVHEQIRIKAVQVLQNFNALEGPRLYPKIVNTEYKLQADQGDHILHGVIDLLADSLDGGGGQEMWDYKGVTYDSFQRYHDDYLFQMQVYAHLYSLKNNGALPTRVVLYLLGELDGERPPEERPEGAMVIVPICPESVARAMSVFQGAVRQIESSRRAASWPPAAPAKISAQDCADCALRWDCETDRQRRAGPPSYP